MTKQKCCIHLVKEKMPWGVMYRSLLTHLLPICIITTNIGQFSADVKEHIILSRGPFLHKVSGKHPSPEYYAVIFETSYKEKSKSLVTSDANISHQPLHFNTNVNLSFTYSSFLQHKRKFFIPSQKILTDW